MSNLQKIKFLFLFTIVLVASILGFVYAYRDALTPQRSSSAALSRAKNTPTLQPGKATVSPTPTNILPPVDTASVLGIGSPIQVDDVSWVRAGYPTCGSDGLAGAALQTAVAGFHSRGLRVLLIICQAAATGPKLFDTQQFNDVAQAGADAVQCGNEQMKQDMHTRYIAPADFARFYDLCSSAVHKVQPNVPVLMGALDPHVGGVDVTPLYNQVSYLNQMQDAMNSTVHPGGNWQWRKHAIGLIDSWHNGYPNEYTNSLYNLFVFWAQQFGVNLQNGDLGKHVWVVEGTGCFKGCGLDPTNAYQVAVSHVLTLITDVQTVLRYKIPFFYFSAKDFPLGGILWPIGILGLNGQPKPIRQDLPMGARALEMSCPSGQVRVVDQVQLLSRMYQRCSLPSDYASTLSS